ncbi:sigma-70 family RNA polymerase sigma factor [bacterium]|nr:sigma-70 family RNA polymerase sigma factor [bacterium]
MDPPNDAELMRALAGGDMEALGTLARRHQDKIVGLAFRMLRRRDLAEDVAQEAFLRVYRAAGRYRPDAKFTTWLYRIVTNLSLDLQRRAQREPAILDESAPVAASRPTPDPLEASERAELVRRAIDSLPDRQRTAVLLHRYQGLSHIEVGEVAGWSQSAVESLLVRAYANLRQALAELKD